MDTKKFIVRLMYFSIGLAGLITAGLILFSPGGDVVSNGIITTLLILLTDGFILVGLVARHEWLKISTWVASLYALIVAVILTWLPNKMYEVEQRYSEYGGGYGHHGNFSPERYGTREVLENLTAGAYIIVVTLAFACVFSLMTKIVFKHNEKISLYSYWGSLSLGIASGLVLGMAASWDTEGFVLRLGFSLLFLALTSVFIMIVATIVASTKRTKERAYRQPMVNPYENSQNSPYNGFNPQNAGSTQGWDNNPPTGFSRGENHQKFNLPPQQQTYYDPMSQNNNSNASQTDSSNVPQGSKEEVDTEVNGRATPVIPPKPNYPPTNYDPNLYPPQNSDQDPNDFNK